MTRPNRLRLILRDLGDGRGASPPWPCPASCPCGRSGSSAWRCSSALMGRRPFARAPRRDGAAAAAAGGRALPGGGRGADGPGGGGLLLRGPRRRPAPAVGDQPRHGRAGAAGRPVDDRRRRGALRRAALRRVPAGLRGAGEPVAGAGGGGGGGARGRARAGARRHAPAVPGRGLRDGRRGGLLRPLPAPQLEHGRAPGVSRARPGHQRLLRHGAPGRLGHPQEQPPRGAAGAADAGSGHRAARGRTGWAAPTTPSTARSGRRSARPTAAAARA